MDVDNVARLFERSGCRGQLCVQPLDGVGEVAWNADESVVSASVFKVPLALAVETSFCTGQLDRREIVSLPADSRTQGPTGFSLFDDDVTVSVSDLVIAMLTISDNAATDVLLDRVGIDAVNTMMARLGLSATVITSDLRDMIDSIGRDSGFSGWASMTAWMSGKHPAQDLLTTTRRMLAASALDPRSATRTTARDMATLLRLIWTDEAGPALACRRVRELMARQVTKHRLAAAFPPPAKVAAKSGSLVGVVRNEVGVITYPDGAAYFAAVFTQADEPWVNEAEINAVIGDAAATGIESLRADGEPGSPRAPVQSALRPTKPVS